MRRILLTSLAIFVVAGGVALAWRAWRVPPAPEVLSLDERPYEQTTDKEREDWMRKLGYVD